jgi:hypothetical protein
MKTEYRVSEMGYPNAMLNDAKIRAAKSGPKAYKLADEHQLYLYVSPQGAKLRRMKFKFDGKEKTLSLGPYPLQRGFSLDGNAVLAGVRVARELGRLVERFGKPTA